MMKEFDIFNYFSHLYMDSKADFSNGDGGFHVTKNGHEYSFIIGDNDHTGCITRGFEIRLISFSETDPIFSVKEFEDLSGNKTIHIRRNAYWTLFRGDFNFKLEEKEVGENFHICKGCRVPISKDDEDSYYCENCMDEITAPIRSMLHRIRQIMKEGLIEEDDVRLTCLSVKEYFDGDLQDINEKGSNDDGHHF